MIETMPNKSSLFLRLILIAAAIYAFKNRSEISHGINKFLARNQAVQEAKSSLKWAYNELRPSTEAEKAQQESFAREQRKRTEEYRKMGINPHIKYVEKDDPEYAETAQFIGKLKRGEVR